MLGKQYAIISEASEIMKRAKDFDARTYMESAVAEMLKSRPERRDDSKISPKVGAVLVKEGGTVDKAHRGELREGDHAEFTLLERKIAAVIWRVLLSLQR